MQNQQTITRFFLPLCLSAFLATGCSYLQSASNGLQSASNDVKSSIIQPSEFTGFIANPGQMTRHPNLPFQKVWIQPGLKMKNYQAIVVAPVNTQYLLQMNWLHQLSSVNVLSNVKQDFTELAGYFYDQIVTDFRTDPNHRFQVVNYPASQKKQTLQLEIALTEINPSMPALHAAGWLIPGGGTAAGLVNQRRASFEGRLRDLKTNKIVATFADRNMQNINPIDLTRLTWWGPAKQIMDEWARQFVEIANKQPGEKIADPIPVSIRPF
jgi:hypothetical protein